MRVARAVVPRLAGKRVGGRGERAGGGGEAVGAERRMPRVTGSISRDVPVPVRWIRHGRSGEGVRETERERESAR
jgi:hypothetical protein